MEAARGFPSLARCLEEHRGQRVVPLHYSASRVEAAQSEASKRGLGFAGLLKEARGSINVPRYTSALVVERSQMSAAPLIAAVTRLAEESCGTRGIFCHARAATVEDAEPRAGFGGSQFTSLREETRRASGIAVDTPAPLVRDAELFAPFANVILAGPAEQFGCPRLILQDVLSFLKPQRELVAGGSVPGIAGDAESLRLGIAGVTCREERERERSESAGQQAMDA